MDETSKQGETLHYGNEELREDLETIQAIK
jgi:predicted HTH domain antitoxin